MPITDKTESTETIETTESTTSAQTAGSSGSIDLLDSVMAADTISPFLHLRSSSVQYIKNSSSFSSCNSETSNELEQYVKKDLYRSKLSNTLTQYKNYFYKLFNVYYPEEANKFINNMHPEKYALLDCNLKSLQGYNELSNYKVDDILQDPNHNITVPAVIKLANQLECGKIKAVYMGSKIRSAYYCEHSGHKADWTFDCMEYPAWVDYEVRLNYELKQLGLLIPLVELKFQNHANPCRYSHHGADIFNIAEHARYRAREINRLPIGKLLLESWVQSSLVEGSIKVHPIDEGALNRLIRFIIKQGLSDTSWRAKTFRKELLDSNRELYLAKLDNLQRVYELIMQYAKLAGASEQDLKLLANPVPKGQLIEDLISLPLKSLAVDPDQSLLDKYTNAIDEFREQIDNSLQPKATVNLIYSPRSQSPRLVIK